MPGKKQDNRRVYPDATRQPRHLDSLRKSEAKERQAAYDKLSLQEKIDRLPATGATKQRARLQRLLEKKNQPKQEAPALVPGELQVVIADTSPKTKQPKKYMKGAK